MPNTSRRAIPYLIGSDSPNGATALQNIATSLDDYIKDTQDFDASTRPAAALAGRYHYKEQNGITYRDTGTAWQAMHNVPFINTWPPPGALTEDGMVLDYMPTAGTIWRLRYRAASPSTYKWEVISAPMMWAQVLTDQTTTSASFVDLTTPGPDITVPREGDYFIEVGGNFYHDVGVGSGTIYMSYAVGAAAVVLADGIRGWGNSPNVNFLHNSAMRVRRKDAIPQGALIRCKYRSNGLGSTAHFRWRWLSARPIRII